MQKDTVYKGGPKSHSKRPHANLIPDKQTFAISVQVCYLCLYMPDK